jgi:hypothetical protein
VGVDRAGEQQRPVLRTDGDQLVLGQPDFKCVRAESFPQAFAQLMPRLFICCADWRQFGQVDPHVACAATAPWTYEVFNDPDRIMPSFRGVGGCDSVVLRFPSRAHVRRRGLCRGYCRGFEPGGGAVLAIVCAGVSVTATDSGRGTLGASMLLLGQSRRGSHGGDQGQLTCA